MDYLNNLKLEVMTTTYVINSNSPIIYVLHDDEGNWTFLSADTIEESDAMVVSLEEIIEFDPSVVKVLFMPICHEAYRTDINAEWRILPKN
jgi:hypothetical protein